MTIFTLLLTAEQPLLMTSLQGDPNSSVSYPYIPGSVLRGALIGRYMQAKTIRDHRLDLHDTTVQALFFDHRTRYLNAYLYTDASGMSRRMLPMSGAWRKEKRAEFSGGVLDVVDATFTNAPMPKEPKPVSGDGCWIDASGAITLTTVRRHINIHNQRDRERGRGVEGSGAVFRYEAIAPGQTFQAVIICDAIEVVSELQTVLTPGTLWLGGSRSAGYGRVQLHEVRTVSAWHEVGADPTRRVQTRSQELLLTLLSDLIIRDPVNGQYTAALPLANLAQQLGLTSLVIQPEKSFRALTYVGGFNRTWGLPLPQTVALAAGSVFTCIFTGALDPLRVAALEHAGLGERRAEGFGRIAINWRPFSSTFTLQQATPSAPAPPATLSPGSQAIANAMAQRLLRQRMERRLEELVGRTHVVGEIKISNTQLSRLRIVARRGLENAEFTQIEQLLTNLPKNARDQFKKAQVDDGEERISFHEWLDRQLRMWGSSWSEADVRPVTLVAGLSSLKPTDELMREYTLRLIMAVARQAVKEVR